MSEEFKSFNLEKIVKNLSNHFSLKLSLEKKEIKTVKEKPYNIYMLEKIFPKIKGIYLIKYAEDKKSGENFGNIEIEKGIIEKYKLSYEEEKEMGLYERLILTTFNKIELKDAYLKKFKIKLIHIHIPKETPVGTYEERGIIYYTRNLFRWKKNNILKHFIPPNIFWY